jgi:PPM family protein phosphatase
LPPTGVRSRLGMVDAFGVSVSGLVRKTNEDGFICDAEGGFFAVADGMGGHRAGEVASRLALDTLDVYVRRSNATAGASEAPRASREAMPTVNRLRAGVQLANDRVFRAAESCDDYTGMGTTVTAALIDADRLTWAHVGDSRLYLLDSAGFRQVTRDETWVASLAASDPTLTAASLAAHPMRHVLTNVVGGRAQIDVQCAALALEADAWVLLCSDGLHGMLADDRLEAVLLGGGSPADIGAALVQAANEAGGHDNITAVVIRNGGA